MYMVHLHFEFDFTWKLIDVCKAIQMYRGCKSAISCYEYVRGKGLFIHLTHGGSAAGLGAF